MPRLCRPRMLLLVLSLPMTLAGCASSATLPAPIKVEMPAECERILQQVAPPAVKAGDDVRVVTARGAVTIRTANQRIKAARACLAAQRRHYGQTR